MSALRRLSAACGTAALVASGLVVSPILTGPAAAATTTTPTVSSTNPASPSRSRTPQVKGTAATGATVTIYSNNTCSGTALGSGTAAAFASPGITVTVPATASTTTFYARATRSGETASACSTTSVSYTHTLPAAPSLTSVSPASPNPSTSPVVKGTAEAGSTVRLYPNTSCTGTPVTGTAAAFASPGLTATVTVGTTTTFKATVTDASGNTSACSSSSQTYTSDLLDGGFEAATGSPVNSPSWAEADSRSLSPLCRTSTCDTGGGTTAPRTGSAWAWFGGIDGSASVGHTASLAQSLTIPVGTLSLTYWFKNGTVSAPFDARLLVKVDGIIVKTTFEAPVAETAYTLQYADLSAFANGGTHTISFDYANGAQGLNNMVVDDVHLSAQAAAVTGMPTVTATNPVSPALSTTPSVIGTAPAGTVVTLYSDSACTSTALGSGTAAAFAAGGITATVPAAATTAIFARATKAAQRDSPCSTTFAAYTQKGPVQPPETTLTKTPKKKVRTLKRKAKVAFSFSSPVAGATFECSVDGGAFAACTSGEKFKLKTGKHTFAVRAVAAGASDASPATFTFKLKRRR
jgi:hypothetical protein